MTAKNETVYIGQLCESFIDSIPYSIFIVQELEHYIKMGELGALDFYAEIEKPSFQADIHSVRSLIRDFFLESDTKLGIYHFYAYNTWVTSYTNEYSIDHEDRVDLIKSAFGTGLAFAEFLTHCGNEGKFKNSIHQYINVANQMTLTVMNQLIRDNTSKGIDGQMLMKLRESQYKNKTKKLYGEFGIYSIFRNCSKFWLQFQ